MNAPKSNPRQLAVLAYGSLLAHPGNDLGRLMVKLIRCQTPFGVEYAGRSQRRGGAPTLVRCDAGDPVRGALIVLSVLDTDAGLLEVRTTLAKREGVIQKSKSIKHDLEVERYPVVYSDFPTKVARQDLTAENLARYAIESVANCVSIGTPFMNGIRYLLENLEWNATTRLSEAYRNEILRQTGSSDLEDAEAMLIAQGAREVTTKARG